MFPCVAPPPSPPHLSPVPISPHPSCTYTPDSSTGTETRTSCSHPLLARGTSETWTAGQDRCGCLQVACVSCVGCLCASHLSSVSMSVERLDVGAPCRRRVAAHIPVLWRVWLEGLLSLAPRTPGHALCVPVSLLPPTFCCFGLVQTSGFLVVFEKPNQSSPPLTFAFAFYMLHFMLCPPHPPTFLFRAPVWPVVHRWTRALRPLRCRVLRGSVRADVLNLQRTVCRCLGKRPRPLDATLTCALLLSFPARTSCLLFGAVGVGVGCLRHAQGLECARRVRLYGVWCGVEECARGMEGGGGGVGVGCEWVWVLAVA